MRLIHPNQIPRRMGQTAAINNATAADPHIFHTIDVKDRMTVAGKVEHAAALTLCKYSWRSMTFLPRMWPHRFGHI